MSAVMIDRGFVRIAAGLVHYRSAGKPNGIPLIMAHAGPGSSAGLVPLITALAKDRYVVAPDMMGNGESDPPPSAKTDIAFYADCLIAVMDKMGIARADFYGSHSGAQVVCELAVSHPDRVGRLILDGIALFPEETRQEYLARYAPPLVPAPDGSHLSWVWNFIAELTQHFPYYKNDQEHAIPGGALAPLDAVTDRTAEVLKVWRTFHIAYGAAFSHPLRERLAQVGRPSLVLETAGDPLAVYAAPSAALIPGGQVAATTRPEKAAVIAAFLGQDNNSTH